MIKLLKILLGRLFKKYNELFFVGSTDILPEPLSKEEEEKYVDMFQNGDLKARDKLIEQGYEPTLINMRFIKPIDEAMIEKVCQTI